MDNKFDDLFNDFFEKGKQPKKNDNDFNKINKIIKNLAESDFGDIEAIKNIEETLGEPDFIDYYEEDGLYYKKEIWHTKMGKVIKRVMSDIPFIHEEPKFNKHPKDIKAKASVKKPTKSLDILLEEAVAKEDYEMAATIRDEIKRRIET